MSALNFIRLPDRLCVIADTAGCSRDGRLRLCASKIRLTTNFPGVICITGNLEIGQRVQDALEQCASFDEMIRIAPARFGELAGVDDAVAIGGYSEWRGWEIYYARAGAYGQPFAKVQDGFCGQPALTGEMLLRGFGTPILHGLFDDLDHFAKTVLTLQREETWGPEDGFPRGVHLVGGHGELATITRIWSHVRTIIEYPDQIGELIKPAATDWNEWRRQAIARSAAMRSAA